MVGFSTAVVEAVGLMWWFVTTLSSSTPSSSSSGRRGTLESGLSIIECLVERAVPMTVTELAAAVEMDKGNVHRLLKVLTGHGWVVQSAATKRYAPTAHIVGLAGSLLRKLDLRLAAEDICADVLEQTQESVHLAQVTSTGPVYILQRRPPYRISVATEVGARPPLHATATGKSVMAFIDTAKQAQWLSEPLEVFTSHTHRSVESVYRDLAEVRQRGFALDDEEFNLGTRCVGVPIFGLDGDVIGCVGVSVPIQRASESGMQEFIDAAMAAARKITANMGGPVQRHPVLAGGHESTV